MDQKTTIPPEAAVIIAGALFDFLGFLTTRDKATTFGASELCTPAVDLLQEWADTRGLSLDEAVVGGWRELAGGLELAAPALTTEAEADGLFNLAESLRPDHPTAA